jgi:hypothetical protein
MTTCFSNYLGGSFSEPAFPSLIIYDGLVEILLSEVGPANIGKIQFSISELI